MVKVKESLSDRRCGCSSTLFWLLAQGRGHEEIYSLKNKPKDRKSDILITPIIKKFHHRRLSKNEPYYNIDFSIENQSTKSIGFDIEFKIYYKEGIILQKRFKLEEYLEKPEQDSFNRLYSFSPKIDSTILDISIEDQFDSYKISRTKRINEKYAIQIPQNYIEEFVFFQEILLYKREHKCGDCKVIVELTMRSDEFVDGPLIKNFDLELKD